jgi:hypothetical protein
MQQVTTEPEKYVTMSVFEQAMQSIARSFEQVNERFDRHESLFERIFEELRVIRDEARETRKIIVDMNIHLSRHEHRLDNLTERVEVLEIETN